MAEIFDRPQDHLSFGKVLSKLFDVESIDEEKISMREVDLSMGVK
jgi:hypothetical protein